MDVSTNTLPKSEIEVVIELSEAELKEGLEKAAKRISQSVKVEGFRPGHVPADVIEKKIGKQALLQEATDDIIPKVLTDVVQKEKIQMIAHPRVEVVSLEPFKLKAVIPVYPEVQVSGYEKVKLKLKETKVTDKEVDEAIENIKKRFVEWKEILSEAKKGDKVEVDFEGFDEGDASLEGTQSKNHPLVLGEGMMVPGFEDAIMGMKTGEEKEFTITFPADYHKESFQNKKVKFKVKAHKVEEAQYPEIDDAFIEKVTGKKQTVEDFKKLIREDLEKYKSQEERKNIENDLLEKFLGVTKAEFSDSLVDEELNAMLDEMKQNMQYRGLTFEQYLAQTKKTEEQVREELKKEAVKRITLRFGLHEIMEKEGIKIEDKDLEEEIEKMVGMHPDSEQKQMRDYYTKDDQARARVQNTLRLNRLFDRFIEK